MECEAENSKRQNLNISKTTIRSSHQGFSEKKTCRKTSAKFPGIARLGNVTVGLIFS